MHHAGSHVLGWSFEQRVFGTSEARSSCSSGRQLHAHLHQVHVAAASQKGQTAVPVQPALGNPPCAAAHGTARADAPRPAPQAHAGAMEYTIVRPGGLKSEPATGQGVLTEDASVCGAVHREDVAQLVVQALFSDAAANKVGW
jgi:NAD(P)H-binding